MPPPEQVSVDPSMPDALCAAVRRAAAGAVIALGPGDFTGPIVVRRDLSIRGAGPLATRIRGAGEGAVIVVAEAGVRLDVRGVSIGGGLAGRGGGLEVMKAGQVTLEDVVLAGNCAGTGGGAIYAAAGTLSIKKSLIHRNASPLGGGIFLDGTAAASLDDVVIEENDASQGGGLFLREAARLQLRHVYVRRNGAARGASALEMHSTRSRAPAVEMLGGGLSGGRPTIVLLSATGAEPRPTIKAKDAWLAGEARTMKGFTDVGGCRFV